MLDHLSDILDVLPPHLEAELSLFGISAPLKDHSVPLGATGRPEGPMRDWQGHYYPDGNIPF